MRLLGCLAALAVTLLTSSGAIADKELKGKRDEKTGIVVQFENYILRPGYLIEGKAQNLSNSAYTRATLRFTALDKDGDPLRKFAIDLGSLPKGARVNFRAKWLYESSINGYAPAAVIFDGADADAGDGGIKKLDQSGTSDSSSNDERSDRPAEPGIVIEKRGKGFLATDRENGVGIEYEWERLKGDPLRPRYLVRGKIRRNAEGPSKVSLTVHFAALARDGDTLATLPVYVSGIEPDGFSRFEDTLSFEYTGDKLKNIQPFKIEVQVR